MERNGLVVVMAISIVNGIFSPWVLVLFVLYPVWFPGWAPPLAQLVYMASALILSTLTVMVSGIAPALYKRLASDANTRLAVALWIAGAMLLTLPALPNVLRALSWSA